MKPTPAIASQSSGAGHPPGPRLSNAVRPANQNSQPTGEFHIGVLPGEGIGPEVIQVALDVLACVERATPNTFHLAEGGPIGHAAAESLGHCLPPDVISFCESIFAEGGAILCGPGGGRFVYELRRQFDLFCKFTPVQPLTALSDAGVLRPAARENIDLVVVRENVGGLYFGDWGQADPATTESAHHSFSYTRHQVVRILQVAITLAAQRRGRLMLALKPGGVPAISALWSACFRELTADSEIDGQIMEIDNAIYQVLENAGSFDVIIAPNMFGDVLSDACSLLLGSRGLSFSGNFSAEGLAVYQTGHGAAHDLAGKDRANPVGQILSTAMMLRESFALHHEARAIETAVEHTLRHGWRTPDMAGPDSRVVGTRELGTLICDHLTALLTNANV